MTTIRGPIENIPNTLRDAYTMQGRLPVLRWYLDGRHNLHEQNWTPEYIASFTTRFRRALVMTNKHGSEPYRHAARFICQALDQHSPKGKRVAVIGSTTPWIEALLLTYGCTDVTTVEYNVPTSTHPHIHTLSYVDFARDATYRNAFDMMVTYSSVEHSGLGRYGDPLEPDADIETMKTMCRNLKSDGILLWGAPVGHDALVWNAHRIYGPLRLPLLFEGFTIKRWIGFSREALFRRRVQKNAPQPLLIAHKG